MNNAKKFFLSTLVAAAAMTSTALAEGTGASTLKLSDYDNLDAAIKQAETLGGATLDLGSASYSGELAGLANEGLFQTNGTYTFTGGNYVDFSYADTPRPTTENAGKVSVNIVLDNANVTAGKFRLDNGASLVIKNSHVDSQNAAGASVGWTTFYGSSTINVTDSVIGWDVYNSKVNSSEIVAGDKVTNYYDTGKYGANPQIGQMCYWGSGVMNVTGSTVFTYVDEGDTRCSLGIYDKGLMTFTDSAVYASTLVIGVANSNKTVGRDDEIATMVFNNTTLRNSKSEGGERIIVGDGSDTAGKLIIENNSIVDKAGAVMTVNSNGAVSIANSTLKVGSLTNSGVIQVSGESTLNIETLTGDSIDLLDGAIVKDSKVGGNAYVAGNVIFRGDNTFTMISDYGDYYSKETPSMWTVEKGASLTLTSHERYGLGYGDKVAVYGEIENARVARENLDSVKESLNMHGGLVGMTNSAAPKAQNSFTVEDAYVRFGVEGDKSFGNKSGTGYYGNYTFTFKNSVVDANGFKFYEDNGCSNVIFTDSDLLVNGVFMTNDSNSTFTFENTTVLSKATSNGSDDKNQNAGTMNLIGSDITYNAAFTNIGKIVMSENSTLTAVTIVNNGSITLNNSTLKVTNLTGTGTLTMLGNSAVATDEAGTGLAIDKIAVNTENGAVSLSAEAGNIVFGGVTETTAESLELSLAANRDVLIAWDINVDANGQSVAVEMNIGEGLDGNQVVVFHEESEGNWTEVESSYDATTGKVSFTTNSFSKYAVAIPEPSTFGLFAGLGALAFVGARRRRRA